MNVAVAINPAIRPERFTRTAFTAFQVSAPAKNAFNPSLPDQRTYALGQVEAETVDQARSTALAKFCFSHKQQLIIREAGPRGVLLHIYAIVKKPDVWVWQDHVQVRQERLDTKLLCIVDGGVVAR